MDRCNTCLCSIGEYAEESDPPLVFFTQRQELFGICWYSLRLCEQESKIWLKWLGERTSIVVQNREITKYWSDIFIQYIWLTNCQVIYRLAFCVVSYVTYICVKLYREEWCCFGISKQLGFSFIMLLCVAIFSIVPYNLIYIYNIL